MVLCFSFSLFVCLCFALTAFSGKFVANTTTVVSRLSMLNPFTAPAFKISGLKNAYTYMLANI